MYVDKLVAGTGSAIWKHTLHRRELFQITRNHSVLNLAIQHLCYLTLHIDYFRFLDSFHHLI